MKENKGIIYCPICGKPTSFRYHGDYTICAQCGWENDGSEVDGILNDFSASGWPYFVFKMCYRVCLERKPDYKWSDYTFNYSDLFPKWEWKSLPYSEKHILAKTFYDEQVNVALMNISDPSLAGQYVKLYAEVKDVFVIKMVYPSMYSKTVFNNISDEMLMVHACKKDGDLQKEFIQEIKERYKEYIDNWNKLSKEEQEEQFILDSTYYRKQK